ncbi:orotidine-5'-phosphate decarboxylase [Saccharicrinis fermentans]|uniref:Orotidine 5'-phosphate decarboxylase n=1 Tax=Saccharicrinis fermentans DSM 9555 = JCM 21142 TaxID=869213 RepID=W7YDY3_9BACT|nr:orotidine-5'-phosphate decarboxylase [Saccharicrinis fermentans]GAF05678.1 orotidine 5'-phosphate decarboxylase [Saccharicrinis fermentans DSM 9555 = JCM 21142]
MTSQELFENIKKKGSFLCVGLDTDINKIPRFLLETTDPLFAFNKEIIDATHKYTVAYKPNLAFYESMGVSGWNSLEKTVNYIRYNYPDIFIIADAKRGDIGNTSNMYAKAFFDTMDFDSVTVAPYMGEDSVKPFMTYVDKWVILLALTSNKGAADFQYVTENNEKLFEKVIRKSKQWGTEDNLMYVVGATKSEKLKEIRDIIPDHFLLVPGVGAQGGSLKEVAQNGLNKKCGLLVNSSRGIIYASAENDFAEKAGLAAREIQQEMNKLLVDKGLV